MGRRDPRRGEGEDRTAACRGRHHGAEEPRGAAISLVGTDIYEKLIKGYTGKQWGRPCTELPAFIIKRLPVRFTYDDNYFNALYQGIPCGGYTAMVEKMLDGVEVRLGVDYLAGKAELDKLADRVVYTGPVDAYFGYKLGALQYRSVRFETETLDTDNYQGNAVVTTPTPRRPTPASSSTSTLSSAPSPRPSSAASTAPSGSPAMNPTTR